MKTDRRDELKRPTFQGIQVLRGFAACMVVVHHATMTWNQRVVDEKSLLFWRNGAAGVDIFFVISGFVMAVATIGREHKIHPARSFMERRIIRLVPLYWMLTAVLLLGTAVKRWYPFGSASHAETPLGYIVSSLLFVPYLNSQGRIQPILAQGWTLSFEMLFYLLFAVALAFRVEAVRMLTPVMLTLVAVGMFRKESWPTITILADPLLLEFLAGLLLGHAMIKGLRWSQAWMAILGIIATPVLLFGPSWSSAGARILFWGVPAYLIVQAVVMTEDRLGELWPRWMLLIGDASYSLYLSHFLVFSVCIRLLTRLHILVQGVVRRQDEVATVLICLTFSVLFSIPLYLWVEKPITNTLRHRLTGDEGLNRNAS